MTRFDWHKSTYSNGGTNCVECRSADRAVDIRDSQNPEYGHITFNSAEWRAFLADVRTDRL